MARVVIKRRKITFKSKVQDYKKKKKGKRRCSECGKYK